MYLHDRHTHAGEGTWQLGLAAYLAIKIQPIFPNVFVLDV